MIAKSVKMIPYLNHSKSPSVSKNTQAYKHNQLIISVKAQI